MKIHFVDFHSHLSIVQASLTSAFGSSKIRLFEGAMGLHWLRLPLLLHVYKSRTSGIQASLMSLGLASVVTENKWIFSQKDFIKD